MSISRFRNLVTLAAVSFTLAACGSSGTADVRLLNTSTDYSSLDVYFGTDASAPALTGVSSGTLSSYAGVSPATDTVYFTTHGVPESSALTSASETFSKNEHRTYVAYGDTGTFGYLEVNEDESAPSSGYADVEVLNTAPDAGAIDVYLTGAGVSLNAVSPNFGALTVGKASSFTAISDGNYELRVTGAGTKSDLRLDLPGIVLADQQTLSIIITETPGGYLVNADILPQQGTLTTYLNPDARVRAAIGLSSGSNVSASVGSTTILSGAPAVAVGTYALVPAGSASVTLSINGSPVSSPSQMLAAGQDYTFLVYDSSGSTEEDWLTDTNRLPASGYATMRLVNAMSSLGDPIGLSVDYVPIASNVALGSASAYDTEVAATTTGTVSVTDSATSQLLYAENTVTLTSPAVYTMFMFGSSSSASGILRQDR